MPSKFIKIYYHRKKMSKISKELNQTVRQREYQDTSDTAALDLITTVVNGRKLGSQKPNLQLFQGPGSSPKLDLTKSAPGQELMFPLSFSLGFLRMSWIDLALNSTFC